MFKSFFMAGFECATGRNAQRCAIDQIAATEHDVRVDSDYALLTAANIHTVREAVRWPLVDRPEGFDFSTLDPVLDAARKYAIEPIWDLFHFGYPERFDPFGIDFALRFSEYAAEAAARIVQALPGPYYFTPVNEGSYFAWAAGEVGLFAPHARGRGYELKVNLARTALAGITAIRGVCPSARFVAVDPICHVVPRSGTDPVAVERARAFNHEVVFQFLDMIAGKRLPELGGSREALDIVGLNYYATNQWELGREGEPLSCHDPRRLPLAALVRRAARRYGGPILITETGSRDDDRACWLDEVTSTALTLLDEGIDFRGVCLYPVLGMPEWHEPERWSNMGLWDLVRSSGGLERVPHAPALRSLSRAQRDLDARTPRIGRAPELAPISGRGPVLAPG